MKRVGFWNHSVRMVRAFFCYFFIFRCDRLDTRALTAGYQIQSMHKKLQHCSNAKEKQIVLSGSEFVRKELPRLRKLSLNLPRDRQTTHSVEVTRAPVVLPQVLQAGLAMGPSPSPTLTMRAGSRKLKSVLTKDGNIRHAHLGRHQRLSRTVCAWGPCCSGAR